MTDEHASVCRNCANGPAREAAAPGFGLAGQSAVPAEPERAIAKEQAVLWKKRTAEGWKREDLDGMSLGELVFLAVSMDIGFHVMNDVVDRKSVIDAIMDGQRGAPVRGGVE